MSKRQVMSDVSSIVCLDNSSMWIGENAEEVQEDAGSMFTGVHVRTYVVGRAMLIGRVSRTFISVIWARTASCQGWSG